MPNCQSSFGRAGSFYQNNHESEFRFSAFACWNHFVSESRFFVMLNLLSCWSLIIISLHQHHSITDRRLPSTFEFSECSVAFMSEQKPVSCILCDKSYIFFIFPGFSFDRDPQLYFDDTCVVPERLEGKKKKLKLNLNPRLAKMHRILCAC